ncbi:hypothetical protein C8R45DRAFT_971778 [Mycena sanguinolenta]|nr:hypothetical protein C8R45DRAFT_971778 [Mycena sanguinolenta]
MTCINWLVALLCSFLSSPLLPLRQSLPTVSFESQNSSISLRISLNQNQVSSSRPGTLQVRKTFLKSSNCFLKSWNHVSSKPLLACSQNLPQDLKNQIPCTPESSRTPAPKQRTRAIER